MFNKKFVYFFIIIFLPCLLVLGFQIQLEAALKANQKPQMVYRIRVANDLEYMENKMSGIRVKNIKLSDYEDIKIDNNPWSYILIYIGIDNIWYYKEQEILHSVEAGVSIRGTEVNQEDKQGWHPFINYYPSKKQAPFNDPAAWRGEKIELDRPLTLELKVGEVEKIGKSNRWPVHFYVNNKEVAVRPIYGNPGKPNQFDVKVCVGAYMASGNENEISFKAFKIGEIEINESDNRFRNLNELNLDDFGIPHYRIGYGEEVKNIGNRNFHTEFEQKDYSYKISLKEKMDEEDKKGLLLFSLLAGYMLIVN